ncbi:MAG: hypothetical protein RDV48_22290 [Candidatus Eremiobacteraeota bacterium]|nr:hypothetical protein [Candidatus Eremiobacteraeota bacterium]
MKRKRHAAPALMIIAGIAVFMTLLSSPAHARRRYSNYSNYYQCESNLRNLATALEMYATDNGGEYPEVLSPIMPAYINIIPSCPAMGVDTYSCGYKKTGREFQLYCLGKNHPELPENMPAYDSKLGIQTGNYNYSYNTPGEEHKTDTAASLVMLGILTVISYLIYRKK